MKASIARHIANAAGVIAIAGLITAGCRDSGASTGPGTQTSARTANRPRDDGDAFTKNFRLNRCTFAPDGKNTYMNLTPGYTLVLAGEDKEAGESIVLRITALNETKQIGGVTARVVEEREWINGALYEIARNYFAMCTELNSVFYFGEDVDFYENGQVIGHQGSWLHGVNGARAGLFMAGLPLLGSRYYQEIAPGVALDRAEILRLNATVQTPFGKFSDVMVTEETTPLVPDQIEYKSYAPDIGLISDGPVVLVKAGFNIP